MRMVCTVEWGEQRESTNVSVVLMNGFDCVRVHQICICGWFVGWLWEQTRSRWMHRTINQSGRDRLSVDCVPRLSRLRSCVFECVRFRVFFHLPWPNRCQSSRCPEKTKIHPWTGRKYRRSKWRSVRMANCHRPSKTDLSGVRIWISGGVNMTNFVLGSRLNRLLIEILH